MQSSLGQPTTPFKSLCVHSQSLVPDLDLTTPVAGGCSCREDGMLRHTQAGLSVSVEGVQQTSIVVIMEVSRASGASRGQDSSIQRKLTLHRVTLHLEQGYMH